MKRTDWFLSHSQLFSMIITLHDHYMQQIKCTSSKSKFILSFSHPTLYECSEPVLNYAPEQFATMRQDRDNSIKFVYSFVCLLKYRVADSLQIWNYDLLPVSISIVLNRSLGAFSQGSLTTSAGGSSSPVAFPSSAVQWPLRRRLP